MEYSIFRDACVNQCQGTSQDILGYLELLGIQGCKCHPMSRDIPGYLGILGIQRCKCDKGHPGISRYSGMQVSPCVTDIPDFMGYSVFMGASVTLCLSQGISWDILGYSVFRDASVTLHVCQGTSTGYLDASVKHIILGYSVFKDQCVNSWNGTSLLVLGSDCRDNPAYPHC